MLSLNKTGLIVLAGKITLAIQKKKTQKKSYFFYDQSMLGITEQLNKHKIGMELWHEKYQLFPNVAGRLLEPFELCQ